MLQKAWKLRKKIRKRQSRGPVLQKLESMENSSKKEPDPVQKNMRR